MRQPNVILINCDDLGYGDLGCYGSPVNQTPAIDRLAAGGIRFTSFYAASPVCSPSRAGLMTGSYPPRVSINRVLFPGEPYGLDPGEYTLPKMFHDQGYQTMLIGKWHCGDQPASLPGPCGFDHYYGLPYSNDMGMQAGKTDFVRFPPLPLLLDQTVLEEQPDQTSLTERYVEQAVRFLRLNQALDRAFFLCLAHMHVHLPLYAAARFVRESANGDYGACVASVDWALAVLVDELKSLGLYDDTIIIFTSDNGSRGGTGQDYYDPNLPVDGPSNAPLRGSKHTTFEGGQRIPMIFSWPANLTGGRICADIGSQIDLLPTLCHLIGGELPAGLAIDGLDQSDLFLGHGPSRRHTFIYFSSGEIGPAGSPLEAVRMGAWKLHRYRKGVPVFELYNLETDLSETTNVYDQHPEIIAAMNEWTHAAALDLGDTNTHQAGRQVRPCLVAADPQTLTQYDENHPYIIALYDKADAG